MNLYRSHDLIGPNTKLVFEGTDLLVTSGITRGDAVTCLNGLTPGDGYTLQPAIVPMAINHDIAQWPTDAAGPAKSAKLTFMTDTALLTTVTVFEIERGHCVFLAAENMMVGREYILIAIDCSETSAA